MQAEGAEVIWSVLRLRGGVEVGTVSNLLYRFILLA